MTFFSRIFMLMTIVGTLMLPQIARARVEDIRFKLDPVRMAGTEIIFNVPDIPETVNFEKRPSNMVHAQTENYTVFIDLKGIHPDDNCACFIYPFYVKRKSTGSDMIEQNRFARFNVQVRSFFKDFSGTVRFQVQEQGQTNGETGTFSHLPLYCYQTVGNFLEPQEIQLDEPLDLFTTSTITLELKNTLTNLNLQILDSSSAEFDEPAYWQPISSDLSNPAQPRPLFTILPKGRDLSAGESVPVVRLKVRPDPVNILKNLLKVWLSGPDVDAHETIRVYLKVQSQEKGRERIEAIQVKVKFRTFWGLFVAAGIGSILGSGIGILLSSSRKQQSNIITQSPSKKQQRWSKFLIAILIAIAAEIAGLLLVNAGSQLVLIGLDLNPEQLLPAMLLGIWVGLLSFIKLADIKNSLKTFVPTKNV